MTTVLALPQGMAQLYGNDSLDKIREEHRDGNQKDISKVMTTDDRLEEKM